MRIAKLTVIKSGLIKLNLLGDIAFILLYVIFV